MQACEANTNSTLKDSAVHLSEATRNLEANETFNLALSANFPAARRANRGRDRSMLRSQGYTAGPGEDYMPYSKRHGPFNIELSSGKDWLLTEKGSKAGQEQDQKVFNPDTLLLDFVRGRNGAALGGQSSSPDPVSQYMVAFEEQRQPLNLYDRDDAVITGRVLRRSEIYHELKEVDRRTKHLHQRSN